MSSSDYSEVIETLSREYQQDSYSIKAVEEPYPGIFADPGSREGTVDLLLEDSFAHNSYKIVGVAYAKTLDPEALDTCITSKENQVEKAVDYFNSLPEIEGNFQGEVEVEADGNLRTVNELWSNTVGVFTWDEAVETVSEPGRLGPLRDENLLLLNYEASRRKNEEHYEFNEELEDIVDIFLEYKVYP